MTSKISLPDMNDMLALIDQIRDLHLSKLRLQNELDAQISDILRTIRTNPVYFENGKPASVSYVEKTYGYSGLDKELLPIREALAQVTTKHEHAKMLLNAYQDMIEIWRTESANTRASVEV